MDGSSTGGAEAAVEVHNLIKTYKSVEAVKGIDLTVRAGETFGFLGPNGAGKSTTIKILCTLADATSGSAKVAGFCSWGWKDLYYSMLPPNAMRCADRVDWCSRSRRSTAISPQNRT